MGSPVNFAALVARAAARFPDQVAIEQAGPATVVTRYAELMADARRWAARLARHGVERGDRVALLGDNGEPWIAAYLGALHLGAVAVPLDTSYRPDQVRTLVEHCGAALVCVMARQRAATAGLSCPILSLERFEPEGRAADDAPTAAAPLEVAPDDPAVILYTSGTTADPKGVVLTHANLSAERDAALAVVDCHERDAVLGVLPLFHALAQMANLLVPLSVGARVVFLETIDSRSLLTALQERGITIFACVPQFFYLMHQRVMDEVARAGGARRANLQDARRHERLAARAHGLEPRTPVVRARAPRARPPHAAARHRRVALRPAHRPRPLRSRLYAPERLRSDGDIGRRHGAASGRPVHDIGRPAARGRRGSN